MVYYYLIRDLLFHDEEERKGIFVVLLTNIPKPKDPNTQAAESRPWFTSGDKRLQEIRLGELMELELYQKHPTRSSRYIMTHHKSFGGTIPRFLHGRPAVTLASMEWVRHMTYVSTIFRKELA